MGKSVFFVWSAEEYAEPFLSDEWKSSSLETITIDEEEIVGFLNKHVILFNVFSIKNLSGFVVLTDEFRRDLEIELKKCE